MILIDGSEGEGGGQVLRTALGLAAATGQPFRIDRIRGNRPKPGLARQHLTGVLAAAAICGARVDGAELGSTTIAFRPGALRGGDHSFAIGTAGSTTLVLQAVLPALLRAAEPSRLTITGGTHNPMAPPFDFLQRSFGAVLRTMGAGLELELVRTGFAPAGGGELRARIAPAPTLRPFELLTRREPGLPRTRVLLSQLPDDVGKRELTVLRRRLDLERDRARLQRVDGRGPGNAVVVELPCADLCEIVTAIGERGRRAEEVADAAADEALAILAADVPVGPHLQDQLLVPMALAGGGAFRSLAPTLHATTNAALIERFLPVRFAIAEDAARPGTWIFRCEPR